MVLDTVSRLLDLSNLHVVAAGLTPDHLTITATAEGLTAACPLCHTLSDRVHSPYECTVLALNWGARTVTLVLVVRRFFCDVKTCLRKIFTERLPEVVAPYARRTIRLQDEVETLAFEFGGEAGARVARRLQYGLSSADTLPSLNNNRCAYAFGISELVKRHIRPPMHRSRIDMVVGAQSVMRTIASAAALKPIS
jgi:hypothetical protein